jgi:hypothetical protein
MAVLTGKSGDIDFTTGYSLHCNSWTVEFATDVFEDTELGDSWRTRVVGINEWSGSYDCALDETGLASQGDAAIGETGVGATANFDYVDGTGRISGDIAITGATVNTSTTGVNTITFTFVATGAPTFS